MKRNGETVEYQVALNIPHLRGKNQQNLRESPCFLREWRSSDRSLLSQRTCLSLCGGSRETGLPSSSSLALAKAGLRLPASASLSLASCWPRPQQLLPVSATGGGRRRCTSSASGLTDSTRTVSPTKWKAPWERQLLGGFSFLVKPMESSHNPIFSICDSPQKSSAVQKVYRAALSVSG